MRNVLTGWMVAAVMAAPAAADPLDARARHAAGPAEVVAVDANGFSASAASLRRVRQQLLQLATADELEKRRALVITFEVHVIGSAPPRSVLDGMDLRPGSPVPDGPPTHEDLRWLWTPWPGGRSMALAPAARTGWRLAW